MALISTLLTWLGIGLTASPLPLTPWVAPCGTPCVSRSLLCGSAVPGSSILLESGAGGGPAGCATGPIAKTCAAAPDGTSGQQQPAPRIFPGHAAFSKLSRQLEECLSVLCIPNLFHDPRLPPKPLLMSALLAGPCLLCWTLLLSTLWLVLLMANRDLGISSCSPVLP